jgi:hypothetical protein
LGAQIITTEHGEELVVLPRREYDALLASLGTEDAEDRMTVRLIDESRARIASGEEPPAIPSEIAYAILDGEAPLRAVRRHQGLEVADLARMAGLSNDLVHLLDEGERAPGADERTRLGAALGVDPRWLEPL